MTTKEAMWFSADNPLGNGASSARHCKKRLASPRNSFPVLATSDVVLFLRKWLLLSIHPGVFAKEVKGMIVAGDILAQSPWLHSGLWLAPTKEQKERCRITR